MAQQIDKQRLELAIAKLDKQFKEKTVFQIGTDNIEPWPAISSGVPSLDAALGIGGLPQGRIVEIYGMESVGKSTLAASVVAEAQKIGMTCAYIDAEHAIDPFYMEAIGVKMDEVWISQPSYGEAALEVANTLIKTECFGVVVIDSVSALIPKAELDDTMEAQQMGLQARMMSKAMRKLPGAAQDTNTLLIFINQIRQKIGVMYGNPNTTSGGLALKFASTVRIELSRTEDIKDSNGDIEGIKVRAKIVKNKVAPPAKQAFFDILYGKGASKIGSLVDVALLKGVFKTSGSWVYYNEENFAQGRQKTIEKLEADPNLLEEIKQKVS